MQKTSIAHPHITLETVTGAAVEAEVAVKTLLKQKKVLLKMLCRCWTQTSSFFQFIVWVVEGVVASEARGGSGTRGRWSIENFVWCSNWNDGSKQPEKQQSCSRNNSRKCLIFCILILYFLGVTVVYACMHTCEASCVQYIHTYIWKRRRKSRSRSRCFGGGNSGKEIIFDMITITTITVPMLKSFGSQSYTTALQYLIYNTFRWWERDFIFKKKCTIKM